MDYRTWGKTKNCKGCRFWSEMIAKSDGGGPVSAMCLNPKSLEYQKYRTGSEHCGQWGSGHYGAIDTPGESDEIIEAYNEEQER